MLAQDAPEALARRTITTQLVQAIASLEQGIGRLAALRMITQHLLKSGQRRLELALDVVRLADPVPRVLRQLVLRLRREESLEAAARIGIAALLEQLEGRLVLGLRVSRRCGRSLRKALRRALGRLQPAVEVEVLLALLLSRTLLRKLQLLEAAAQRTQLHLHQFELAGQFEQALIIDLALELDHPLLDLGATRLRLRERRGGERQPDRDRHAGCAHLSWPAGTRRGDFGQRPPRWCRRPPAAPRRS